MEVDVMMWQRQGYTSMGTVTRDNHVLFFFEDMARKMKTHRRSVLVFSYGLQVRLIVSF